MEEFLERDYGEAEGLAVHERMAAFPNKNYPNQEERSSLTERVRKGMHHIAEKYENSKILLVAHGAVINVILAEFSNGEIDSGKTKLANACLTNIHFHQESWKIESYNEIAHLTSS